MEGHSGHTTDLSILPKGCQDAIQQSEMSGMMHDLDMSGMESMDEAQKAFMQAQRYGRKLVTRDQAAA
jgi:hypothetical protein